MTWTSEDVYAKDLQPGDRFTSRWAGDHTVALSEACTLTHIADSSLGGLYLHVEMPSGDRAVRLVSAGNRVFRWTEEGEPEVAAAVKGLGPSESSGASELPDESIEHFLPEALTTAILADRESTFDSFASAYAAEASEDSESEPETEATKVLRLGTYLVRRDELEADIAELRRDLSAMWGE